MENTTRYAEQGQPGTGQTDDQQRREREERDRKRNQGGQGGERKEDNNRSQMKAQYSAMGMTRDHGFIKEWILAHGGQPARVKGTEGDGRGLLFVDFGQNSERIEQTSWEDFFYRFDKNNLAFFYDEIMSRIIPNKSFKFVFT